LPGLLEKAETSFETVSFELREMSKKKCEGLGDGVARISDSDDPFLLTRALFFAQFLGARR
jgi:hypothetical protein